MSVMPFPEEKNYGEIMVNPQVKLLQAKVTGQ